MRILSTFDQQLARHELKLRDELQIDAFSVRRLASKVWEDVSALATERRQLIVESSPVSPRDRIHQIEQTIAFNAACNPDLFANVPGVAYAHTITLSYISVVYLSETLFDVIYKILEPNSPGKKSAAYLRNNPVRAFRNALAHGHWKFRSDGTAIEYWARKGSTGTEPMAKWEVSQNDLVFWYSLSRAVGYAALKAVLTTSTETTNG